LNRFKLNTEFSPAGDQERAIESIVNSINKNSKYQTLLGVTGSGKTFTMANVIEKTQKPTLIMTHNKTLAAQLYSEFRNFFPNNRVEYFISYYDYYQPEAYIPRQDLFIEKDSSINSELERLRLSATASLLNEDDVIVIASVSANYGLGNPKDYYSMMYKIEIGESINQKKFLLKLVDMGYSRDDKFFDRAKFRVNGDIVDIFVAYFEKEFLRVEFFGDDIDSLALIDIMEGTKKSLDSFNLFGTTQFVVEPQKLKNSIDSIEKELDIRLNELKSKDMLLEYKRLKERVEFDLEMLETTGSCKGIENYSRHLTGKKEGETPYSLIDYFELRYGDNFLLIVDESHVSLPQFRGMYSADRSRKETLVEYGFRLPSALDNRPLTFDEFINKAPAYLFVSATPAQIELDLSQDRVFEQIIRPTGLLDPVIEIRESTYQVEDLYDEIKEVIGKNERVLITVLTKKMAQTLSEYYSELGLKVKYMHSDTDVIERNTLIRSLRVGKIDILIGINLLREGLDLPEVSLIAILDADKEGFLRSETTLIQTIGRAARNINGKVLLYSLNKKITNSMQSAIDITNRRREIQDRYNKEHNITPKTIKRKLDIDLKADEVVAKKDIEKLPKSERAKMVKELTKQMLQASKELNFEDAIRLRDEIERVKKL
jgi:excinuclease ABC subunit B